MPKTAVIFDFDGTLADSMGVWTAIDKIYFSKYNLPLTRENADTITVLGFEGGAKFVREVLGLDMPADQIIQEWNDMAYDYYAHQVRFKAGALDRLHWLKDRGVRLGVATSNREDLVQPCLANNNATGIFEHFTYSNDLGLAKSDPQVFLDAAAGLDAAVEDCVVFEDTVVPARAAKEAGFLVVGVRDDNAHQDTPGLRELCDIFIDGFADVGPGTPLRAELFGE